MALQIIVNVIIISQPLIASVRWGAGLDVCNKERYQQRGAWQYVLVCVYTLAGGRVLSLTTI
jgi:hypothetical protein